MQRRFLTLGTASALAGTGLLRSAAAHESRAQHAAATAAAPAPATVVDIVRNPSDLPGPIGNRGPQHLKVNLETTEVTGRLDDGATYTYWTYNDRVPGPFVRVRVGDTVEVTMKNAEGSSHPHNVDFHAVTGPGGGGAVTVAAPGESKSFTFRAINPGIYVYHCAVAPHAQHIANGMYGLILVEPEGGLPPVDREFYVMQGELYTDQPFGARGEIGEDFDRLLDERPTHVLFNGAVGALTERAPLKAKVGETVRIFFGVGGPNLTSSFHVIGEIFDRVFSLGDLTSRPLNNVQTITVAPGGAAAVDFKLEVPGRFLLVDHALSRLQKGCLGFLDVEGPQNPGVFSAPQRLAMNDTGH
ncbi:copper-containing nitrite reductase [Falsiroseomonas sp. CW058]|uniref:copper-containing nitrite reductase n=1 Tax=Falsiroseomonas sp. CW058 TaxID=3388664 RepID=UPI003D315933